MAGETDFGTTPSSGTRIGNPLLYTRRIFLCVISSFFAQDCLNDYEDAPENPYKLICNKDGGISKKSRIFITDRYVPGDTARRPQIVIGRGAASWGDQFIGDWGQGVGISSGSRDIHKSDTMYVPIEISIYSQNDIEAENIAWSTAFCIKAFEREIRIGSLLFKLESTTIGPAVPDKVSDNIEQFKLDLQTGATIGLRWQKTTTLTSEEILKGFCKISGDPYPVTIKDLCIFAEPEIAPDNWT